MDGITAAQMQTLLNGGTITLDTGDTQQIAQEMAAANAAIAEYQKQLGEYQAALNAAPTVTTDQNTAQEEAQGQLQALQSLYNQNKIDYQQFEHDVAS